MYLSKHSKCLQTVNQLLTPPPPPTLLKGIITFTPEAIHVSEQGIFEQENDKALNYITKWCRTLHGRSQSIGSYCMGLSQNGVISLTPSVAPSVADQYINTRMP